MTDKERDIWFQKQVDACDVKVGDTFYHVNTPEVPYEVIKYSILGWGLYFYIASFDKLQLRLCKRVELYNNNKYFTYFRTSREAKIQQYRNEEVKLKALKQSIGEG